MEPLATVAQLSMSMQRTVDPAAGLLALQAASGMVRDYVGWNLSEETTTFTVDGSGHQLLSLPTLHLTAVTEVRLLGTVLTPASLASFSDVVGTYEWSERGQLFRAAGWPAVFRSVQADVTHGYAVMPDAILAVVLALAGGGLLVNPGGALASKTVGGVTHTYRSAPTSFTELQTFQLSTYRL